METLKFHHGGILILFSSIYWFGILPVDAGVCFCFLIHMLGWHSTSWCRCYFPFSSIYWVHILPLDMDFFFFLIHMLGWQSTSWYRCFFFPVSSICWVGILPLDTDVFSFLSHPYVGLAFYLLIWMFFSFLIHMLGWHSTSWYGCFFFPFSSIYWVPILPCDTDVFFLSHPYVRLAFYLLIQMFLLSLSHPYVGLAFYLLIRMFFFLSHPMLGPHCASWYRFLDIFINWGSWLEFHCLFYFLLTIFSIHFFPYMKLIHIVNSMY